MPEHKKINDLLADFQSNKIHMAIVVDEYGSTLGLSLIHICGWPVTTAPPRI